jgi:hypothetical protein
MRLWRVIFADIATGIGTACVKVAQANEFHAIRAIAPFKDLFNHQLGFAVRVQGMCLILRFNRDTFRVAKQRRRR